jgi:hypothetical protein
MKRRHWLITVAAAIGILVWVVVSAVASKREAWDSPLYFVVGIPLLCVVAAVLALIEPDHPWKWAVVPLAAQAAWMFMAQGFGNLAPLGVLFFGVLAIPLFIAARIGAFLGKRRAKPKSH